jgi:phosphoglycerol transferase MdoB-like AlkP superfamily enzyme
MVITVLSIIGTFFLLLGVYETGTMRGRFPSASTLKKHHISVDRFLATTIISVIVIEGMIRARYGLGGGVIRLFDTITGQIHLIVDVLYAISLFCMRFWLTGLKSKKWHVRLFVVVVISYFVIMITGAVLVGGLISKATVV